MLDIIPADSRVVPNMRNVSRIMFLFHLAMFRFNVELPKETHSHRVC